MKFILHKNILCGLMVLCFCNVIHSQTACIKAVVTDSSTKEAIPGVNVVLNSFNRGTASNGLGKFEFNGLAAGDYQLKLSYLGYETKSVEVRLNDGDKKELFIQLEQIAIDLKEVTTSQSGEQTMTIISNIDKQLRPVNSAQDLLRLVPGLFIAQHAGGGKAEQIFLRGFDCDHGTDFSVNIDGMPVNVVSHAHGQGYADFHFVIPETIDKLKVYKGTYTTKYGDFATAGAGEFSTKNSIAKSIVKVEAGQFDTYRAMAMIDVLQGKHLFTKKQESAYIAAEYNYTNSYFQNSQDFKRYNVFGKYTGLFTANNFLSFSLSTFGSSWNASGQIPDRAVKEGMISRFGSLDNSEGGATDRTNANMSLLTSLKNGAVIKNQVYYSNYHFNLFSNFTFFLHDSIHGDEINQTEKGRNIYGYSGTYEKSTTIGGKNLKSIAGIGTRIDVADVALRHAVRRVILDTVSLGKLYEQNANAYIDETLQLTTKFSINAGARLDYFYFSFKNQVNDSLSGNKGKAKVSPKLNLYYDATSSIQLFAHAGFGFHSNDARSVVLNQAVNSLPRAIGYEAGSTFKLGKKVVVNAALWGLDLQNELVYVGDEAIVEINGATRRLGGDLSIRCELTRYLYADVDLNYSHGRFLDLPQGQNYIPLAPSLTSIGGLTVKQEKGFNASLRYRYINSRPAAEDNSVTALGYFLLDAVINYSRPRYQIGISAENLLNSKWNQAQFDTQSRLRNETQPVNELHYTPGTPFFIKGSVTYLF